MESEWRREVAGSGGKAGKASEKRKPCIWASRWEKLIQQWREGKDIPSREAALIAWGPEGLRGIN